MGGFHGVVAVQWLPGMLYFHIEHVGWLSDLCENMSKWLNVTWNFVSMFN